MGLSDGEAEEELEVRTERPLFRRVDHSGGRIGKALGLVAKRKKPDDYEEDQITLELERDSLTRRGERMIEGYIGENE